MNRKSLFLRYFLSYLGIIFISVITFGMLFYYFNVISLNAEVKNNQFASVSRSLNRVDYMLESMSNIAYHFSSQEVESGYYQYREQKTLRAFPDLIAQRLSSYVNNMTEDAQLLLYFRGDTDIYSVNGVYRYFDFEEHVGTSTSLTMSGLFSTLNSSQNTKALRLLKEGGNTSQDAPLAAFVYPVPYMSLIPEASLAFLITEREFTSIFDNYSGVSRRNTYLLDNSLNIIYSSEAFSLEEQELTRLVSMKGIGTFEESIQNQPSVVMRALSENSGYSLIVCMEEKDFYSEVGLMRRVIVACLLLFTAVSVLWALIMATRNYRPIRQLARNSGVEDSADGLTSHYNELEVIQQRIDTVRNKNRELDRLIDQQRPYVAFTCLSNILRGKVDDQQEMQFQMQCASISFPEPYLQVLLVVPAGRESISEKIQLILAACEEVSVDGGLLYSAEIILEKKVAVLLNFQETQNTNKPVGLDVSTQLRRILQESQVETSIGIGSVCTQIEDVHTSFIEAAVVVNEYIAAHSGSIMSFEEIPTNRELDYSLSFADQSMLAQSIRQGDHTAASLALDRLIANISEINESFLITQYLCFDIANTLLKASGQAGGKVHYSDLQSLRNFQSLDEFRERASKTVQNICDQFSSLTERKSNQLSADVIAYVNRQYQNNSLSLEEVAAHFELSPSHLSRFFKQATGRTFIQYVTQLRMNYIKQQLTETDQQIKDIITQAGYIDAASFVRKFKNAEGVTPSQYRQLTKKDKAK